MGADRSPKADQETRKLCTLAPPPPLVYLPIRGPECAKPPSFSSSGLCPQQPKSPLRDACSTPPPANQSRKLRSPSSASTPTGPETTPPPPTQLANSPSPRS